MENTDLAVFSGAENTQSPPTLQVKIYLFRVHVLWSCAYCFKSASRQICRLVLPLEVLFSNLVTCTPL